MTQLSANNTLNSSAYPNAWLGIVQVILAAICWGSLGIFSTYLNQLGFSGWQVTILRVVTSGVILLTLLPMLWSHLRALNFKQWTALAIQSLIGVLGMSVFYFLAVVKLGAGPAVALLYTAPVFSLFFSALLLNEQITKPAVLLALMSVTGVGLTMLGDEAAFNWGILAGLMSGVCYSLYGVLGKRALGNTQPAPLVFFTSVSFSAWILMLTPSTFTTYQQVLSLPVTTWGYVFGLSLIGTVLPFALYMKALEKLPATRASVFTTFEPLTALLLASLLLHQSLAIIQYVGISFILIASVLNSLLNNRPRKPHP